MPVRARSRLVTLLLTIALAGCGGDAADPAEEESPVDPAVQTAGGAAETQPEPPDDAPAAETGQETYVLGAPRDDLERFYGLYGDPEQPGRDFFVAPARRNPDARRQIPAGYLMIGATWGDVAPWYMKARSDTVFEQQWVNPHHEPLVVAFELGEDDEAVALTFESVFEDRGTVQRLGDLPEKWR